MTNDRPKVLHVLETLGVGGAEQLLVHLAPELMRCGVDIECLTLWDARKLGADRTLDQELNNAGIKTTCLDIAYKDRVRIDKIIPQYISFLRTSKPDIIHSHLFFAGNYTALLPRWMINQPRLISFHSVDYDVWPAKTKLQKLKKAWHGLALRYGFDVKVAVSGYVAESYRRHFGFSDLKILHNAVPSSLFQYPQVNEAEVRAQYNLGPNDNFFVVPARLIRAKGHTHLVQAMHLLRQQGHNVPYALCAGHGPLRESLTSEAQKLGVDDKVIFLGGLEHHELMTLIQAANFVVIPSVHEGFGVAAAEAMALQKAVIVTSLPSFMEFIRDRQTGLLAKPHDAVSLANTINELNTNPQLCTDIAKQAKEHILNNLSTEVMAPKWVELYQDLLKSHKSRVGVIFFH